MPVETKTQIAIEGEWECMECGYTVDGVSTKRPKACPECQSSGSEFEFFEFDDEDNWSDDEFDYDDDLDED